MRNNLCITIRFLQLYSHARGDGGEPEWPPSPLRLFQALCAAAAARWNERQRLDYAVPALEWIESQPSPIVVAGDGIPSDVKCLFYVPDNTADLLVPAWKKGEIDKGPKRTEKIVCPTHLLGDAVHYLYPLPPEGCMHEEVLKAAARSVTHLGWGIDMVAADARVITQAEADKLPGHRWRVVASGGVPLRVPKPGTLADLMRKHQDFLGRVSSDGFRPVPPLSCFDVVRYHSPTAAIGPSPKRPFVAFQILKPDLDGYRVFDAPRRCSDVARWVRHAAGQVCQGWRFQEAVAAFVLGHDGPDQPIKGPAADRRFMYLPLPSIERRGERGNHVGAIRRVLIAAPPGCADQIDWVRKRLAGFELVEREGGAVRGILNLLAKSDWVLKQYTEPAAAWATVTPVVLPGHDDRNVAKARALLLKAFHQTGLAPELLHHPEFDFDFRKVGFLPGVDHADRYVLPEHPKVKGPRYHVWVRFPHAIPGPLAVGAIRYRGMGLFARHGVD